MAYGAAVVSISDSLHTGNMRLTICCTLGVFETVRVGNFSIKVEMAKNQLHDLRCKTGSHSYFVDAGFHQETVVEAVDVVEYTTFCGEEAKLVEVVRTWLVHTIVLGDDSERLYKSSYQ